MGRRSRTPQHQSRNAEDAFAFLVSLANRKDLGYLLEVGAGISAIAGFAEPMTDSLARSCHYQVSRIVLDATLRSSASTEWTARPRREDLSTIINNAIDATNFTGALQRMSAASGSSAARLEMTRFLAQLGQVQIAPFEHYPAILAGRAVGLLDDIPIRRRSEIERRVAGARQVLDLPAQQILGVSVLDAAKVYLLILKWYADRWNHLNARLPEGEQRKTEALRELDDLALQNYWSFTPESVTGHPGLFQAEIRAFLNLFSRTPAELRVSNQELNSPYGIGHVSCRMLPLDRNPVVALSNDRYLVPNVTIFRNAFGNVIDFSLMDAYRQYGLDDLYNQARGAALELYLEELISDRLPSCLLIPEIEYRSALGSKKSPDLCILDLSDRSLIAVEVKARRLSPAAAVETTDSDLDSNHGPSVDALRKLPGKIEDLFSMPEFEPWQQQLAQIPEDRVIFVAVVGSAVFFHDELEPLRARLDPSHPLAQLDQPFCLLDLAVFERAVELARRHQLPLGQLLREHHEDTRAGDADTGAARLFRGREMPEPSDTFAWRFI